MENIILQFLNIYFWVFIVTYVIKSLYLFTNEYKETKKNAIKNANDILKISKTKQLNLSGVTTNLQVISGSIKTVQALLQNGIFNMNDGERLSKLDTEYQKAKQADGKIKSALIRARFR